MDDGDSGTTGQFALAKVAQKIRGNRFSIRTSEPNVEVSWEVKAVRNDRFVQCTGAPVEVEKSAAERGKYLAPALFGQPAEKGIFYHGVADVRGTGSNEILTRSAASDVARDPAVAPARQ